MVYSKQNSFMVLIANSWNSAIDNLAKFHLVSPEQVKLSDYGRASAFYSRQLKTFERLSPAQAAVQDTETSELVGSIPHWNETTSWFQKHLPQDRTSLVHGDYKIDNCVFHPTEPYIIGILDWELSTIGHPLSDLANLLQPYSLPTGGESSLQGFSGRDDIEGIPTLSEAQLRYAKTAKWNPANDWVFAEAFSHLRVNLHLLIAHY